ncbi:uncharacterized mitochondrial protein AtMg00810-like [Gossypium hirsutum]|uniref:Uncharacterized mitochondrial protein AtMg00810-like n=1 Tax=Gossypium hirsutum TaxID=3635 RepID=A0A1U8PQZ5_GOSHI|nr:uncharacterized mitochondrial protein AtMg00810-like [Gossypium hirsutum]
MSDMGLLHYFLGLEVHQAEDGIFISQRKYAKDFLSKFGMLNCKPATTPMNINQKLQQEDREEMADVNRFRSLVGGLIYLMHIRPDIAFPVGVIFRLCGFTDNDWASSGVITWSSKKQAAAALSTLEAEYIVATSAACQAI